MGLLSGNLHIVEKGKIDIKGRQVASDFVTVRLKADGLVK